jgi:S-adenosylmethionine decarboxylase
MPRYRVLWIASGIASRTREAYAPGMKDLCPQIARQRLVIEGKYTSRKTPAQIRAFFRDLSEKLGMTIIHGPLIKDIAGGFNQKHKGIECVLIWAESGASLYVWDKFQFFTLDIYTCKSFDPKKAVAMAKEFFAADKLTWKSV